MSFGLSSFSEITDEEEVVKTKIYNKVANSERYEKYSHYFTSNGNIVLNNYDLLQGINNSKCIHKFNDVLRKTKT